MKKKTSLSDALGQVVGKKDPAPVKAEQPPTEKQGYVTPSRQGKKIIAGHFTPEVSKQFKLLALENDITGQDLLSEAIGDLFEKYGRPRLL